jgi:transcriptional regulator with XRE-family HTH domain
LRQISSAVDNEEVVKIGAQLKRQRERALLTQGELSERTGIGVPTISKIENGKVEPRFSTIRKLAHALSIDPRELVEVDDDE